MLEKENDVIISENSEASLKVENEMTCVSENVALGILGAVIGGLIGAIIIVAIGLLGFIASLGGVALAFATLTGYEKLAKKLSIKGITISVVIMILTLLFAMRLEWAINIYYELLEYDSDVSLLAIFVNLTSILNEFDAWADYAKDLVALFIFTVLGAFPTIKSKYLEKKDTEKTTVKKRSMKEIASEVE